MKQLSGRASGVAAASAAQCVELLAAVDRYPEWYPEAVREVVVLERDDDGRPSKVHGTLHAALGPLARGFDLILTISVDPGRSVRLARVPNEPSDPEEFELVWRLDDFKDSDRTQVHLQLDANLDVPRLVPVGGLGDGVARGIMAAAIGALQDGAGPSTP
jgi:Polyketide cyclase / dehydrase and lipid transport